MFLLERYSAAAGPRGAVPARWPEDSQLPRAPGRPVLVVFAHPECSCTRATLAVLAEIASELGRAVDVDVVIDDDIADPERSDIAVRARQIRGVRVVFARAQAENTRFGDITPGNEGV